MPSAVTKLAVGRVGAAGQDIRRVLSDYRFTEDKSPSIDTIQTGDHDPIWTWNAPSFLTGDTYGIVEQLPLAVLDDLPDPARMRFQTMKQRLTSPDAAVRLKEKVENLTAYFTSKADFERTKGGRTHYRLLLSLDLPATNKQIQELTTQFLKMAFPKAIAFAAVHRDTGHTHVHIHIHSRQIDCKRIQLKNHEFKSIDEKWASIYAQFAGDDTVYTEHVKKKEETRQWRRAAAEMIEKGGPVPARLARVKGVPWRRFKG